MKTNVQSTFRAYEEYGSNGDSLPSQCHACQIVISKLCFIKSLEHSSLETALVTRTTWRRHPNTYSRFHVTPSKDAKRKNKNYLSIGVIFPQNRVELHPRTGTGTRSTRGVVERTRARASVSMSRRINSDWADARRTGGACATAAPSW